MEPKLSSIRTLVNQIKAEMFSTVDLYSFVSPSAYDTAWMAMIPHPKRPDLPLFRDCLNWVLNNQRAEGFWGESNHDGLPTIDCFPATLASVIVLKKWNIGNKNIEKGLAFIQENVEILLKENSHNFPRWFAIVFPAMVELAQATGLEIVFPEKLKQVLSNVFFDRQQILEMERLVDDYQYPPLLSYLEAMPSTYEVEEEDILMHLSGDGSLFQSPSATARAFMVTGNPKCMDYLVSLAQRCPHGVAPIYPMDEDLIKLSMVNQIQRLGLAEHFNEEIKEILSQFYRSYKKQESWAATKKLVPAQIYKDSLAFRLLRMNGYRVTPWSFCWFLNHEETLVHMEKNSVYFASAIYNVYRATDLMFPGEYEMEEARSFSRKLLEKIMTLRTVDINHAVFPNFHKMIEHELSLPWMARLDHLDHRMWIEGNKVSTLWIGKASFYRLSCLHNDKLMQLAVENYEFRQSIYRNELEELKRWSKDWGLSEMGFGREKTTYCYFAVAASSSLPHNSKLVRMIVAKSAILITVADDFYDMEGSLNELQCLTEAVQIWDGKGLSGHGKIIFDALDNLVSDIGAKCLQQEERDITKDLQDIWCETFVSWLMETTWSKNGYLPSMVEYLETGMTSIATHTIVLPASCFLSPSLSNYKLKPPHYRTVTKLLMLIARLLNDIQSYQKEQEVGKMNFALLYLKENPQADIEDSIDYVRKIIGEKKKELLEHVLMDGFHDLPKPCKLLHLSCLKVFQMFFNSRNLFDSKTDLLQDIMKAIYVPLHNQTSRPPTSLDESRPKMENSITCSSRFDQTFKHHGNRSFRFPKITMSRNGCEKVFLPPKINLCFI